MNEPWLVIVAPVMLAAVLAAIGMLFSRIRALEVQITEVQTKVAPFWASVQSKIADALHQPDDSALELDKLLENLENLTLTPSELTDLEQRLRVIRDTGPVDAAQKAGLLLKVMPMVLEEAAGDIPTSDERSMAIKLSEKRPRSRIDKST